MCLLSIYLLCLDNAYFTVSFFFFNDTATTEIYTLSLHDALPICLDRPPRSPSLVGNVARKAKEVSKSRSEEHTSELQSRFDLVCRLLLEKKKNRTSPRLTTSPIPLSANALHSSCEWIRLWSCASR